MNSLGELNTPASWWWLLAAAPLGFNLLYYGSLALWGLRSSSDDRQRDRRRLVGRTISDLPGITIVIPARNEAPVIVSSVLNALGQDYPRFEIIVIDDGSEDGTVQNLLDEFDLRPTHLEPPNRLKAARIGLAWTAPDAPFTLVRVDEGGSKAAAVNLGVELASYPFVAIRDADSLMEPDVLERCISEILQRDEDVVAVGCTLLPANDCEIAEGQVVRRRPLSGWLVGAQTIEYLSSFVLARPGMAGHRMLPFVSGGFGLFSRQALIEVGGLQAGHLGEDLDLCLRLHQQKSPSGEPYTIAMVPEAVVWTEVPTDLADLRTQRRRWQWGFQQSMHESRDLLQPGNGWARWGFAYLYVFEWWGLFLEVISWALATAAVLLGLVPLSVMLVSVMLGQMVAFAVLAFAVTLGVRRSSWLASSADLLRLAAATVFFLFGYRQLTLMWRIEALFATNRPWGDLHRHGFHARELELT